MHQTRRRCHTAAARQSSSIWISIATDNFNIVINECEQCKLKSPALREQCDRPEPGGDGSHNERCTHAPSQPPTFDNEIFQQCFLKINVMPIAHWLIQTWMHLRTYLTSHLMEIMVLDVRCLSKWKIFNALGFRSTTARTFWTRFSPLPPQHSRRQCSCVSLRADRHCSHRPLGQ